MRSRNTARSPNRRQAIVEELSEHTNRIKELMQEDITFLEQENAKLRVQCLKTQELEQKIQLIIKHNEDLAKQNQKLQRFLSQKLDEIQILKVRSENRNWEIQKKKLYKELDYLRNSVDEVESIKSLTIQQVKNKHRIQIENIMQENQKGILLFEKQLRRMKEKLDRCIETEKDLQIKLQKKQENIIKLYGEVQQKDKQIKNQLKPAVKKLEQDLRKMEQQFMESQANYRKAMTELTDVKSDRDSLKEKLGNKDIRENSLMEENERIGKQAENLKQELDKVKKNQLKNQEKLQGDINKLKNERKQLKDEISDKISELQEMVRSNRKLNQNLREKDLEIQKNQETIKRLNDEKVVNQDRIRQQQTSLDTMNERINRLIDQNKQNSVNNQQMRQNNQKLQKQITQKDQVIIQLKGKKDQLVGEVAELKVKIKDLIALNNGEVTELKTKLQEIYQKQIIQIKVEADRIQGQMAADLANLEDELRFKELRITQLQQELTTKQKQITILNEDEQLLKENFFKEGKIMKEDLNALNLEYQQMQKKNHDKVKKLENQLRKLTIQINKKTQELTIKASELNEQKRTNSQLQQQLSQLNNRYDQRILRVDSQIKNWQQKYEDIKMINEKHKQEAENEKSNVHRVHREKLNNLEEQIGMWRERFNKLQAQNQSLKQFIRKRDKIISELEDKTIQLHRLLEEREATIDELRIKIVENQKKIKQKYDGKRNQILENYDTRLNQQQQIYESRFIMLQNQVELARKNLADRQKQIVQILKQYKKLRDQMIKMADQSAEAKQYSLKFPGATAELIASKNMFDVFIKTKVLEYCGDALSEQNAQNKENIQL